MTYFVGMTHNREFDFWECNFARSDETEAREELKRLYGKACYQIQLFRMEEVPGTRSEFFEGAAVQPSAARTDELIAWECCNCGELHRQNEDRCGCGWTRERGRAEFKPGAAHE
jgi:hypothetical protein